MQYPNRMAVTELCDQIIPDLPRLISGIAEVECQLSSMTFRLVSSFGKQEGPAVAREKIIPSPQRDLFI